GRTRTHRSGGVVGARSRSGDALFRLRPGGDGRRDAEAARRDWGSAGKDQDRGMVARTVLSMWLVSLAAATAQDNSAAGHTRRSDVIYGRKDGVALTLEILTPRTPNGLGVVWVVSGNGISSREQTLQPSFERRVSPLLDRGYTVFAAIHGSSPRFQLQ